MTTIRNYMDVLDSIFDKKVLRESPEDVRYITKMKNLFTEMENKAEDVKKEIPERTVEEMLVSIERKLGELVASDEDTHKEYETVMDDFKTILGLLKKSLNK